MISKKNIVLTSVAALGAALFVLTQTAGTPENYQSYKLNGSWIVTVPGTPLLFSAVIVPSDSSGRKGAVYGSLPVPIPADLIDPNVPHADVTSDFVGEVMMTGPDTAKLINVGHVIQKVTPSPAYPFWDKVAYVWVGTCDLKFTGPDKIDAVITVTDYAMGADGLPDTSKPLGFSMQAAGKMVRVGF